MIYVTGSGECGGEIEFNINGWSKLSYKNSNLIDLKFPKQLK